MKPLLRFFMKPLLRYRVLLFISFAMICLFISCNKNEDRDYSDKIIGTWKLIKVNSYTLDGQLITEGEYGHTDFTYQSHTFLESGTRIYRLFLDGELKIESVSYYKVENNQLLVWVDADDITEFTILELTNTSLVMSTIGLNDDEVEYRAFYERM